MEARYRLYNDDSVQTIRMQRQKISKLKRDNSRLKEELALETRQAKIALQMSGTAQISKLQDQGDLYSRKIDVEKRRIAELDAQIKKMEESILQHRSEMGGVHASRETSKSIQKNIRMLENRLDKALVKFNEALGHNKKLRESIDNLRRERVVFDGIYKKLEADLEKKKNEMAQIIEVATSAYESRDEAQCQMQRLKEQADKEQRQFESEWKELGKLIEHDRKMKDFMGGSKQPTQASLEDSSLDEEQKLRKRLSKGAWAIVKDKANIHISQVKVKSYEEAFEKIQQASGISDIDTLVKTFIDAEDKNFALFNEVNKLSNEIERLEENITTMKQSIQEFKVNSADNQRKKILEDLESKLASTEEKTRRYQEKFAKSVSTVDALKDGITSILEKIGADNSAIEMLRTSGVTESNMMEFLAIIEQKTNGLIEEYLRQEKKTADVPVQMLDDKEAEAAALGVGIGASSLQSVVINPPQLVHTDSEGEDDEDIAVISAANFA